MKRLTPIVIASVATFVFVLWRGTTNGSSLFSGIGRLLRNVRCGDARSASNDPALRGLPRFDLTSDGFADGGPMAPAYVGAHAKQPPLQWSNVPPDARELVLVVEDIDVPFAAPLVHAVAYGIDPARGMLPAGAIPPPGHGGDADPAIHVGRGSGGRVYLPPTPIPGHGPHRYVFALFAVRERLRVGAAANKAQLLRALRDVAIARAIATGTHENA